MKKIILILSILSILNVGCQNDHTGLYSYQKPNEINDGLQVGSLADLNIDTALIVQAANNIYGGNYHEVHSMLIFKDNKLVFEEYFPGHKYKWDGPGHHGEWVNWDKTILHGVKSVTKSITATCIGIAIDKGFIESVNQSMFDYLPDHQHLKKEGKENITIQHLVTMTSGLEWDEWGASLSNPKNDIVGLWFPPCEDQVSCILERPLVSEPGTSFTYSGGNMILLGEIIRHATKMPIDEFSTKYLFGPLGIDSSDWALRFENGVIEAAGSLELTPRSMAKIGIAFLNYGVWEGEQIVSGNWVEKSSAPFGNNQGINIPGQGSGRHGYSYGWWTKTYSSSGRKINIYNAGGWGGQEIIVVPEMKTVVVFTGGNYTSNVKAFKIFEKYILPTIDDNLKN